jgi:uncharacterized phage infection (PIP) family protein YhgE
LEKEVMSLNDGQAAPDNVDLDADPLLDEEINKLKTKIDKLTRENNAIRDKIENTNGGIEAYISEMSTLVDSQDFNSLFSSLDMQSLDPSSNQAVLLQSDAASVTNTAQDAY